MLFNLQNDVWTVLGTINDPEVPVLSILDLGIVRNVAIEKDSIRVTVTPTYSGCPAMDMIATQIRLALTGYKGLKVSVNTVLSPAWTTDWMTEAGKQKLKEYGIAPPRGKAGTIATDGIECPQCHSTNTKLLSEFGSTACKALYQCQDCKEPFDYFKCH